MSYISVYDEDDIEGIVDNFYGTLSRPLTTVSLFYTLYTLSEIEQIPEAKKDFIEIRDRLFDDFWYYGLNEVADEINYIEDDMGSLRDKIQDTPKLKGYLFDALLNKKASQVDRELRVTTSTYKYAITQPDTLIYGMIMYEQAYKMLSNHNKFLDQSLLAFTDINIGQNVGGDTWAVVVRHMLARETLPKTIWVDSCWAVQHNTGMWLIGIEPSANESKLPKRLNLKREPSNAHVSGEPTIYQDVFGALYTLLEEKRQGNLRNMIKIARKESYVVNKYEDKLVDYIK